MLLLWLCGGHEVVLGGMATWYRSGGWTVGRLGEPAEASVIADCARVLPIEVRPPSPVRKAS